jgi:hypothetical protein
MRTGFLLAISMVAAACGAGGDSGKEQTMPKRPDQTPTPPAKAPSPANLRIWGETDTSRLHRLDSANIGTSLAGKSVSYNPPGWADTGVNEEYREDGVWQGLRLGRGPMPYSGRWRIAGDRLCTTAETGLRPIGQEICREVWRDPRTGELLMEHIAGVERGLMRLTIQQG